MLETTRNAGDAGSIPGWERSPGEGNGSPLQYPCLENLMDWGAWWATVHGVTGVRHNLVTKPPYHLILQKLSVACSISQELSSLSSQVLWAAPNSPKTPSSSTKPPLLSASALPSVCPVQPQALWLSPCSVRAWSPGNLEVGSFPSFLSTAPKSSLTSWGSPQIIEAAPTSLSLRLVFKL